MAVPNPNPQVGETADDPFAVIAERTDPLTAAINVASGRPFDTVREVKIPEGTRHYSTAVVAASWDAFDSFREPEWQYKSWFVGPDLDKVEPGTEGSHLHEHKERVLPGLDSRQIIQVPSGFPRPTTMVCPDCQGALGREIISADPQIDPEWIPCARCDGVGRVHRPTPLPFTSEDFGGGVF